MSEIMCPALRMPEGLSSRSIRREVDVRRVDELISVDTRHKLFGGTVDKKFGLEASVETKRRGLLLLEP